MKVFPIKIKSKRKFKLCDHLTNNKQYTLISIFLNPLTKSGMSIVVVDDNDISTAFDSGFFRLNSINN